jgi:hypothetical protein
VERGRLARVQLVRIEHCTRVWCMSWVSLARSLVLGQAVQGARGLTAALGLSNDLLGTLLKQGLSAVEVEFLEHGTEEDKANLHRA